MFEDEMVHIECAMTIKRGWEQSCHIVTSVGMEYRFAQSKDYNMGINTTFTIIGISLANCCAALFNTTSTMIKSQVIKVGNAGEGSWTTYGSFLMTPCSQSPFLAL